MEETNINMLVASLITSFNKFQDLMIDNIREIKDDIRVMKADIDSMKKDIDSMKADIEELKKDSEENKKRWEENNRRWDENDANWKNYEKNRKTDIRSLTNILFEHEEYIASIAKDKNINKKAI
mgnify:CR=1 FL=1